MVLPIRREKVPLSTVSKVCPSVDPRTIRCNEDLLCKIVDHRWLPLVIVCPPPPSRRSAGEWKYRSDDGRWCE